MKQQPERRFRFEEKTSDIALMIQLPADRPGCARFKESLRNFLALLGQLARRHWT